MQLLEDVNVDLKLPDELVKLPGKAHPWGKCE